MSNLCECGQIGRHHHCGIVGFNPMLGDAPCPGCSSPDRSRCPHGVKPWYNCEECQKTSTYHFSGNFK